MVSSLDGERAEVAHGEAWAELLRRKADDLGEAMVAQRDPAFAIDHAHGLMHMLEGALVQREAGSRPLALQVQLVQPIRFVGHAAPFPSGGDQSSRSA